MLDLDTSSSLYQALKSDQDATAYFLFDIEYADADIAREYWTTKSGSLRIGDTTYLPYRIPFSVEPPRPTSKAVDQALFSLALAPRSEDEMELEKDKWEGRVYPQVWDPSNPNLRGIAMTVKVCFETGETSQTRSGVVWERDSSVRIIATSSDLVRAWINLADANPPDIQIAPEQLPAGIFTATAGGTTVANEPVYLQVLRYDRPSNHLRINFGTQFSFVGPSGDPNDGDAAFAAFSASAAAGNRWLTPEAEQRYTLRILNRSTREYRDIPFSSMTRGPGGTNVNYFMDDANLEPFMVALPNYTDESLPESFRQYGANTSLVEIDTFTTAVTDPLTLYEGKLHSVGTRRGDGGYALSLTFSSPFAKIDNSSSLNVTPDDQKARDLGDTSLDWASEMRRVDWGRK